MIDDAAPAEYQKQVDSYFKAMSIPLIRGRTFEPSDWTSKNKVAVIDELFAKKRFPNGDAVGGHVTFGDPGLGGDWEIVGVARDAKYNSPRESAQRMVYLPIAQLAGVPLLRAANR